jgi:hypothetical protein
MAVVKKKAGRPRKQRSEPLPVPTPWPQRKQLDPVPPPPANATGAEVDAYWMKHLPSPRDYMPENDDNCADFLRDVARVGGAAGLDWVWVPRINGTGNWPFSSTARGRMQYLHVTLMDNAIRAAQREAEQKARRQVEAQEEQRLQARRAAGWA